MQRQIKEKLMMLDGVHDTPSQVTSAADKLLSSTPFEDDTQKKISSIQNSKDISNKEKVDQMAHIFNTYVLPTYKNTAE